MNDERVLVTGGSGFIGGHCIAELIQAGYRVHTTIRSSAREADVRTMVAACGVVGRERLTFTVADLTSDDGWPEAVADCDYVLHVASPFPPDDPEHEEDVIVPARDGTLRVLRAARDAGIRRVVLTSSFAAVGYGHGTLDREFTEEDWTNLDGRGITAYVKSKVLAERAAWDFINSEGRQTELTVINPVATFGPVFSDDLSSSIVPILTRILTRGHQMANVSFPVNRQSEAGHGYRDRRPLGIHAHRSLRGLLPANLRPQPAHHAARLTWLVQSRGGAGLANRA